MNLPTGSEHAAFLNHESGSVCTVGRGSEGQLGHGDDETQNLREVEALPRCVMVGGGSNFTACVTIDGDLYCFGHNNHGQLGQGHVNDLNKPHRVQGLPPIQSLACGDHFTVCVGRNSTVWSFGYNYFGQLGLGHTGDALSPVQVVLPDGIGARKVACGGNHTLILGTDDRVYGCGKDGFGLVHEQGISLPTLVPLPVPIESVHCGNGFSVLRTAEGSLWSAGDNTFGQLGVAQRQGHQFQEIPGLNVVEVSCGREHVVAIDYDGSLWGWGHSGFGQLSPITFMKQSKPLLLYRNVRGMVTGHYSTIIRTMEDQVMVCGYNEHGQLALGHKRHSVPVWTKNAKILAEMIHPASFPRPKSAMSSNVN